MSLLSKVLTGVKWTSLSVGIQSAAQVIHLVVMARLLTPADFGIAGIAALFSTFLAQCAVLGIGPALVQKEHLSDGDYAAGCVTSASLSLLVASVLVWFGGEFMGWFSLREYGYLAQILAILVVAQGLSAPSEALLQREFRFGALSALDGLAAVGGLLVVAPGLAFAGYGAESIVWGLVAQSAIKGVGLLALRPPAFRSSSITSSLALVRYGTGFTLAKAANFAANNGDNLVIARVLGAEALGLYGRAYQLMIVPVNLLALVADRVLFSAFSRMQHDSESIRRSYKAGFYFLMAFGIPCSLVLVLFPCEIVHVLFGDGWERASPVVAILGAVQVLRISTRICDPILRALGAVFARALRQWVFAGLVVGGASIGAIAGGLTGAAYGVALGIVVNAIQMHALCVREVRMTSPGLLSEWRLVVKWLIVFAVPMVAVKIAADRFALPPIATIACAGVASVVVPYLATRGFGIDLVGGIGRDVLSVIRPVTKAPK